MTFINRIIKASAIAGTGLLFATGALAQDKIAIAMSGGVNQVPTLVAEANGYFTEEGLDVDLKPVARGANAIEAVAGGSVQLAESAHTTFFSAVNKGLPLKGVAVAARSITAS